MGEIILILFVYLLLFGAKGVPALAQTLGKAVYQFRNAARDVQNEIMQGTQEIRKSTTIRLDQIDVGLEDERLMSKPTPPAGTDQKPPEEEPADGSGERS